MKGRSILFILALAAMPVFMPSCSNTRLLGENEYRLEANKVEFKGNAEGLSTSDVSSYIKQQSNNAYILGWIYNWSNPAKDDWFNNALRKIGKAPVVFNGFQVSSSQENIIRHLDYLGYYNSEVTPAIDTIGKNVRVTYYVTPGARCRIDTIVFKVPEGEFAEEFDADKKNILVKSGDWLSEKVLESESARGASYFRNRGYYDLSKNNYFFEADTLGSRNKLIYQIREYTRNEPAYSASPLVKYHIGQVQISHSAEVPFREEVLKSVNVIHPGDLYSEKQANVSYSRLTALRVFNNVGIEMTPSDSATVDCRITMRESKPLGFKFNFEASTNSTGLMGISPNLSFYHKNIFHGGEWLSLGFSGNFQRKFDDGTRANEFGINGSLSLPRFLGLPYSAFKGPNIPRTEVQASINYQNRPEFERFIASGSFGYTGNDDSFFYQFYPFRATVIKVSSMSQAFLESLYQSGLWHLFNDDIDAGIGGQLYWTTDASVIPKGSYQYARLVFDVAGNTISLLNPILPEGEFGAKTLFGLYYSQYIRAALDLGRTIRFSPSSSLALRLSAGGGHGYGKSSNMIPYEKQFYVGGASSMRGWQARTLGPGDSENYGVFSIPSQVGDIKMEFDAEFRQKLFWKLEGAVFAEAGNVWDFVDFRDTYENVGEFMRTVAMDWGLGLRLNLDFILLRLDFGMKIYEPSRKWRWSEEEWHMYTDGNCWVSPFDWLDSNGGAIHFGVGYPF